jgi:ribosomal protein L25 (general stress protein Ctc)
MKHILLFKIIFCFLALLITACGNSTVSEKKVRKNKKPSLCPAILVDKNTDNITVKNDTQQTTNLMATIKTNHVTCTRQNGIMTLSFNIDVTGKKTQALHDSHNAYIPVSYYITLNLIPQTNNKQITPTHKETTPETTLETTQGIYFITLKGTKGVQGQQTHKMFASQRRAVALPISEYHFNKSNITIGFISQDKTIMTH